MTVSSRPLRAKLLIGASIGAMLFASVAEAQDRSGDGVFGRRGGGDPTAAAARAAQDQATRVNETNSATRRAVDTFRRAAETRQAVNDAQVAARAAARAAHVTVPNGLGQGGLQVANGVELDPNLWIGAKGPVQSQGQNGRTNVSIDQTEQKAILTWDSFNVGRETDLVFNQGGSDWVALNRVVGNSADPSRILGTIKAEGTVLILNQNGILFGGASQVNVRNLVASTANITNTQFLENGIYSSGTTGAGANLRYLSSFTGAGGAVTVEAGAQIATNTPGSVVDSGGYVLLMGSEVTNAGSITTPRGQTLLAAGTDFALIRGQGTDANQTVTTRGSLLTVNSGGGTVTNAGVVEAAEGDITLVGKHVVQGGVALATTTVNARGTIHLLTDLNDAEASVTLTGDSLTMVVPQYDSKAVATDAQRNKLIGDDSSYLASGGGAGINNSNIGNISYVLPDRKDLSRIDIRTGGTVDFQSGSQTIATGGQVAVVGLKRVFAADGSLIDVSGSQGVALSMESNNLLVNVQPFELRDSPLNRESESLKSNDVWIDVRSLVLVPDGTGGYEGDRYYTPNGLLEVGGHLGNIERGIGEWTAQGGTITIRSDEIVAQKGAVFDISGGSLDYQSGYIHSTQVMGADGRLYDINTAPAGVKLVAYGNAFMRKHERWGEQYTEVWSDPLFSARENSRWEAGYTIGRDAGILTLRAPTVLFESEIVADVVTGERQTGERPAYPTPVDENQFPDRTDGYKLPHDVTPLAGQLYVGLGPLRGILGNQETSQQPFESTVVIGAGTDIAGSLDSTSALSGDRLNRIELSAADLNRFGLGELRILTSDSITVEEALTLRDGGAMRLRGQTIDVQADLTVRSGLIGLFGTQDGGLNSSSITSVTVGEGIKLDTSGLWVNLPAGGDARNLAHLDGGDIVIRSNQGDIRLGEGSLLDASAGGAILIDGSIRGADGGDMTLYVGNTPHGSRHRLVLDGTLQSYGTEDGAGGTLALTFGDTVEIGGSMLTEAGFLGPDEAAPYTLVVLEDAIIPAGTVLTRDVTVTKTHALPGEALTQDTAVYADYDPNLVVTSEPFTVPDGIDVFDWDSNIYVPGDTIPAGTSIYGVSGTLRAGTPVPAALLPDGVALSQPILQTYPAGEPLPVDYVVAAAGSQIRYGEIVGVPVKVRESTVIDPAFFQQGFRQYNIRSYRDIVVADGATVDVAAPVRRFTQDSAAVASGAAPGDALELRFPDMFREDAASGRFLQRAGAGISLTASNATPGTSNNAPPTTGSIFIGKDATLRVDDGQSIALDALDSILVEGTLEAHGGNIALTAAGAPPAQPPALGTVIFGHGKSIWINDGAVLDVSGRAHEATDKFGRRYAHVSAGGSVSLTGTGATFVVTRPGALIDISGASAEIDFALAGARGGTGSTTLATNGGSLALSSARGIVLDAELRAAGGGEGALGGLLSINQRGLGQLGNAVPAFPTPDYIRELSKVVLDVEHVDADLTGIGFDDCITACWTPGQTLAEAEAANAGKPDRFLMTRLGTDKIEQSGFGSLTLASEDVIVLNGAIDLTLAGTLTLDGRIVAADGDLRGLLSEGGPASADADSILRAGYVNLRGTSDLPGRRLYSEGTRGEQGRLALDRLPAIGAGTLTIEAGLIDAGSAIFGANGAISRDAPNTLAQFEYPAWKEVHLNSTGDIRLTGGEVRTAGDLTLTAAQVYPITGAQATLSAGAGVHQRTGQTPIYTAIMPGSTLRIQGIEGVKPAAPLSLYGSLTLRADTIEQGGIVRAPLGQITLGAGSSNTQHNAPLPVPNAAGTGWDYSGLPTFTKEVNLLDGSVTSVSAADLVIPYGGTVDGLTWIRKDVNTPAGNKGEVNNTLANQGVIVLGSLRADEGSVLDLSGGGTVAGGGFIPGRGGSIDVLANPLYDISPAYRGLSSPGNKVYALVPAYQGSAAPVPEAGREQPGVGQQIVIPQGVTGVPAGTYMLLPAEYALLEGAFRVELGGVVSPGMKPVTQLADGSFFAAVGSVNALTGERSSQPLSAIITPRDVVKTYSEYNTTDLATFFAKTPGAALFGNPLPTMPQDGKMLLLGVIESERAALSFNGTGLFAPGKGGRGGTVAVVKASPNSVFNGGVEILADGAKASEGFIGIHASDLNATGASAIIVGGMLDARMAAGAQPTINIGAGTQGGGLSIDSTGFTTVAVRDGALLRAPQVFLVAGANNHILVEDGARISSIGMGAPAFDTSGAYIAKSNDNMLAVSNGLLEFTSTSSTNAAGSIRVEDGARLHSDGTLAFVSAGAVHLSDEADYGGRYVNLSTANFNIGGGDALAAAEAAGILPSGITINQQVLARLMAGSTDSAVPATERLILTARQQINFYGPVDLDTGAGAKGEALQLVLNAPALYGHGGNGDAVSIRAGTLVWNGVATQSGTGASETFGSVIPGAPILGGPGYGTGTLNLIADTIVLGYQDGVAVYHDMTLDRLALGFSTVNLVASDRIVSAQKGSLSVWQQQAAHGEPGTGGTLNLIAPVLTGKAGSVFDYRAGGQINMAAPDGSAPYAAGTAAELGGEIRLTAASIVADTAVALPSGRLVMTARQGDVTLGDNVVLDMAGRGTKFFDQTRYSWGGDVLLESAHGDVTMAENARIELGARHNHAGTLKVTALKGTVALEGAINGHATGANDKPDPQFRTGGIDIRAGSLTDFAGLNTRLTESGITDSRSFIIKTGNLTIGDEVKARNVTISVDGGSLTVNGRIDASGAKPGSIRLSARDDLTIAGGAELDVSASTLWVDSYGAPVEASNRGLIELTSAGGTLTLAQGATLDLASADGVSRGRVELNARRVGTNDVAIQAAQTVNIVGAKSVAVNGFRTYQPQGGRIDQALMDGIHADSDAFINAAINNTALLARMAGLTAYAKAFHLRPGVELVSAPGESLSVSGDLNLAGHRYASLNPDTQRTSAYGSGEPGVLLVRAANDLNIFGSITDGFGEPARTPDDNGWVLYAGPQSATSNTWPADYHVPSAMRLGKGATLPMGAVLGYDIQVDSFSIPANRAIAAESRLGAALTLDREWVLTADVRLPDGTVHARGTILPSGTLLPSDTVLGAGTVLPQQASLQAMTWPAGKELPVQFTLSAPAQLQAGDIIPRNSNVQLERLSGLLAEAVTLTESIVLLGTAGAGTSILPNTGRVTFPFQVDWGVQVRRDVPIDFGFINGSVLSVPAWARSEGGWVATAPIWAGYEGYNDYLNGAPPTYNAGDRVSVSLLQGTYMAAGTVLPRNSPTSPGHQIIEAQLIPANADLSVFTAAIPIRASVRLSAGTVLPAGTVVQQAGGAPMRPFQADGTQGRIWAVAPMLPQGSESWSLRLVAGADIASADGRTLRAATDLAEAGQRGDLILSDRHYVNPDAQVEFGLTPTWADAITRMQNFSVIRTGTGSLDLLAGGAYRQDSLYGIYTAGTPTQDIGGTTPDGYNVYNQPRARLAGGAPENPYLGDAQFAGYLAAIEDYRAWYPDHGGDLLLSVQGDIRSYATSSDTAYTRVGSGSIGNWLWRQGAYGELATFGGAEEDIPTAWWINFGGYVPNDATIESATAPSRHNGPRLEGFMGIGTLGGGNLTVTAGGNAGVLDDWGRTGDTTLHTVASSALNLAVASTGRVTNVTMVEGRVTGGTLVQTGGGDMVVKIGGALNPARSAGNIPADLNGTFLNLRGDMDIAAGSIGFVQPYMPQALLLGMDPRVPDPLSPPTATSGGGIILAPGDGKVSVTARGDLVINAASDPGRVTQSAAGVSFGRLAPPVTFVPIIVWTDYGEMMWGGVSGQPVDDWALDPSFNVCEYDPAACKASTIEVVDPDGDPVYRRLAGDLLRTGFSLWREDTSIALFSAGGDLTPVMLDNVSAANVDRSNVGKRDDGRFWFPGKLSVVAASGDLYMDAGNCSPTGTTCAGGPNGSGAAVLELAPSPRGSLEFLVAGSLRGAGHYITVDGERHPAGFPVGISGMALNPNDVPNPFRPNWGSAYARTANGADSPPGASIGTTIGDTGSLLPFQQDTALGTLYTGQRAPMRFYAVSGDINNFSVGFIHWVDGVPQYVGAGPAEIRAGRDIVNFGSSPMFGCPPSLNATCRTDTGYYLSGAGTVRGLVVHNDPRDISILSAGRDILYSNMNIAGPGNLVVEAGRNIYQADRGIFRSVGPLVGLSPETRNGGASITVLTGVGAGGPQYARFLDFYLNPANTADPERPLGEQNGVNDEGLVEEVRKAAKNYTEELAAWLKTRYGYNAVDGEDARSYFGALPEQAQAIFARQIYFEELKLGGREYSGKIESGRLGSYLRSRLAIAALFPQQDADGNPLSYGGNLTMFGGSGVRTEFGGNVEFLVAGGQTVIGVGGTEPPSTAGVLSMGSGDINIYSLGSILLGRSRVFTTFGGDLFMWSAQGDINAGRGAKSTVVYQPPRRVYDNYGNVTLSPPAQNTGAGIATLAPIPEVPAGDVDLIAPLGTIDAGEAGIRVSGDINLAALQILNAANIKVEGEATGIPQAVVVNTGALTAASSASTAVAAQAADLAERSRPEAFRDMPSIITGRLLGFGE